MAHNYPEDGFKAQFPVEPEIEYDTQTNLGVKTDITLYTSEDPNGSIAMVAVYDFDYLLTDYDIANGINGALNGFVDEIGYITVQPESYSYLDNYAVLFSYASINPQAAGEALVFVDESRSKVRIYLITYMSYSDPSADFTKFLNNFQLISAT